MQCGSCSHTFELNKKISDRDDNHDVICPSCNTSGSVTRLVSSALVGYSTVVGNSGYGRISDGFNDVLHRIHERAPGSRMDKTSTFMR